MNRKRMIAYSLTTLGTTLAFLFVNKAGINAERFLDLNNLVGLAAIASGISGILMNLSSKKVATFEAIREYFQQGDTEQMIANRQRVYATEDGVTPLDIQSASEICSFFHFWGMMVRKGYLPIWIFNSASGPSIVRLYHLLLPYINERRASNNHYYAKEFEYLSKRIQREYKFTYTPPTPNNVLNEDRIQGA
ncbi:DUF4760 domain-containing protein [Pseudobacillus wudalianchiensis]|uniref:Uncharacterized protein n=1 Tax=Pseudobacillus wudalianchiensis TaxID=1743143 RepID=A0A1B9AYH2_9BACI|nr:hypothetical protein [Bacillus wudalianchiensis]OCA88929.1 hypothetical protein A8F95_05760 [Bacillus wudalianchiensis]